LFHYAYKLRISRIIGLKTMTLSSSSTYKKDFHFVIVGTVKGEYKEVALEILKTMIKNTEEINEIRDLNIFGKLSKCF
jgi:hypothetical protein